jgi:tetratricopeptide (TPR) repeat protein
MRNSISCDLRSRVARLLLLRFANCLLVFWCLLICGAEPKVVEPNNSRVALEWAPSTQPPLPLNEMEEACTEMLRRISASDSTLKGEVLWRRSQIRFWRDDGPGYLEDARAAMEVLPNHLELRRLYGLRFLISPDERQTCYSEAEQLMREFPAQPHGYYLAGRTVQKDNLLKAIEYFSKAIARDSANAPAYLCRSMSYLQLGKYEQGLQDAEKTLSLPPLGEAFGRNAEMAKGLGLYGMERFRDAVPYLERNRGSQYEQEATLFKLWICYELTDRFATCLVVAESHVRQFPRDFKAHVHMARSLATFGRNEEALRHAKAAIELNESSASAWSVLGHVQMAESDYLSAIESFRHAHRISGVDRDVAIHLGFLLSAISDDSVRSPDEAKAMLDLAMSEGVVILRSSQVKLIQACVAANDEQFQRAERIVGTVADDPELVKEIEIVNAATYLRKLFRDKKPFRLEQGKKNANFAIPSQPRLIGPTGRM